MKLCAIRVLMLSVVASTTIHATETSTVYTGGYKSLSAITDKTKRSQLISSVKSKDVKNISDVFPNIIGGEPADDNEFPWFGRTKILLYDGINTYEGSCAGSLIYSDIVVTAAHCIADDLRDPNIEFDITFYLGANDFSGADGTPLEVDTVVWPMDYVFPENDIAYYILRTPADVDPVRFNTNPSIPVPGAIGTAIGFGDTSSGEPSPVLLKVDLPSISNEECIALSDLGFEIPVSATCSYDPLSDKSTCFGDSGGPIIADDGTIFGITSFGPDPCSYAPVGFTRTSYFTNFTSKVRCDYSAFPPDGCVGFPPEPCGLFGLSIFCPFTFGGIIGRFLRALFGKS